MLRMTCGVAAVAGHAGRVRCKYPAPLMEAEVAQRAIVTLEDDLGGGPADETVHFAFGGAEYEIDFTAKNTKACRKKAGAVHRARPQGRATSVPAAGPPCRPPAGPRARGFRARVPRLSMRMRFTIISSPLAVRARSSGLPVVNADP